MTYQQRRVDADRKAAELIVWAGYQLAAGGATDSVRPLLAKLPQPWSAISQKAMSQNGQRDFLASVKRELTAHPRRFKMALDKAEKRAEASDEKLVRSLPRQASIRSAPSPVRQPVSTTPITTWPTLSPVALYGVAGDFVRLIEPHTEADPAALLVQMLVAVGNVIGPAPFFQVEADAHRMNLFSVMVGETSKARKGCSWAHIRQLLRSVDGTWVTKNIPSGLASGEGAIWAVRDPIEKTEPIRERKQITGYRTVIEDQGVDDKRLLVLEPEFASVLRVLGREGNKLSAVIRQAWDSGNLHSLTKNSIAKATGAHISIVGHITQDELRRYMTEVEVGNGFANRFLWTCVRRSKELPEGGDLQSVDLGPIVRQLDDAVAFAREVKELKRDEEARALWRDVYGELSAGRPGMLGAVTSRSEAQVLRLSCIYALLDCSTLVRRSHLEPALALWDYCDASARYVFGSALGDPVADRIVQALRRTAKGMTRTQINNLLDRNVEAARIDSALQLLQGLGHARREVEKTDGRPAERWFAARLGRL